MPLYLSKNYRNKVSLSGFDRYEVKLKETDLHVSSRGDFSTEAHFFLSRARAEIENFVSGDNAFKESFSPVLPQASMPNLIKDMALASVKAGVGPMAAVAGTIAGFVGRKMLPLSSEVIIENGGDIYMKLDRPAKVAVFAGTSSLSMKIGIKVNLKGEEISICSSSGTVGHSLSGGNADAAVCIARSPALADAAATAVANEVLVPEDIGKGLEASKGIDGITGCMIICGDKMGAVGDIEICNIN